MSTKTTNENPNPPLADATGSVACGKCGCLGNAECGHEPLDKDKLCTLNAAEICPCCRIATAKCAVCGMTISRVTYGAYGPNPKTRWKHVGNRWQRTPCKQPTPPNDQVSHARPDASDCKPKP